MYTAYRTLLRSWWDDVQLPTWLVLVGNYVVWLLLTWYHASIPWWLLLFLGAFSVCLHGSLQHEFLHGHPTSRDWLNKLLVWLPLGLWMPYTIYRDSHIAHHRCERLTDPTQDPESFYIKSAQYKRLPNVARFILSINNTLAGRLVIGPIVAVSQFWFKQARRMISGDRRYVGVWMWHLAGCAAVLTWVLTVCGLPLGQYVLLFAWPGLSLTLLRSYTEHRPSENTGQRTIIVEGSWVTRLLFLNNNYHHVHHSESALAWYQLAKRYNETRESVNQENGGFYFGSYYDIFRNYLFRLKDAPVHPFA